jgi:hypothetical protein
MKEKSNYPTIKKIYQLESQSPTTLNLYTSPTLKTHPYKHSNPLTSIKISHKVNNSSTMGQSSITPSKISHSPTIPITPISLPLLLPLSSRTYQITPCNSIII